jgi:WD40 repeat protein
LKSNSKTNALVLVLLMHDQDTHVKFCVFDSSKKVFPFQSEFRLIAIALLCCEGVCFSMETITTTNNSTTHSTTYPVEAICTKDGVCYAATSSLTGEFWMGVLECHKEPGTSQSTKYVCERQQCPNFSLEYSSHPSLHSSLEYGAGIADMCWGDANESILACATDACVVMLVKTGGLKLALAGELSGHNDIISSVCNLGDDRVLSSSHDMTSRIYDVLTQQAVGTFDAHCSPIACSASAPDDRSSFATASSADAEILLWNETQPEPVARFHCTTEPSCLYFKDSHSLYVGRHGGYIDCIDLRKSSSGFVFSVKRHAGAVRRIIAAGTQAVSGGDDGAVLSWGWDSNNNTNTVTKGRHGDFVRALAVSGNHILSGGWDKTVRYWSL